MDQMTLLIAYVVVAGGAFWFFGRKQRQRAKEIQAQRDAMKIGDKVVTIGGLHGVIDYIDTVNKNSRPRLRRSYPYIRTRCDSPRSYRICCNK